MSDLAAFNVLEVNVTAGLPGPPGNAGANGQNGAPGDPDTPFLATGSLRPRDSIERAADRINLLDYALNTGATQTTQMADWAAVLDDNYGPTLSIAAGVRAGAAPGGEYSSAAVKIQSPGVGWSVHGDGPPTQIENVQFDLAYTWNQLHNIRLIGNGGGWNGEAPIGVRLASGRALLDNVQVYQRPIGFSQTQGIINPGVSLPAKNVLQNCLTYQCAIGVEAGTGFASGNADITAELRLSSTDITSSLATLNPITFVGDTHSSTTIDNINFDATKLKLFMGISGTGIPTGAIITFIDPGGDSITISKAATTTVVGLSITAVGPGVGVRLQHIGQLRMSDAHILNSGLHGLEILGHENSPAGTLAFPNECFYTGCLFGGSGLYGVTGHTPRQLEVTNIVTHASGMLVTVTPSTEDWARGLGPIDFEVDPLYDATSAYVVDVIAPDQLVLNKAFNGAAATTGTIFAENWSIYAEVLDGGAAATIRGHFFTGGYSTLTRISGGMHWSFVNVRMNLSKWIDSYVAGLFELRCLDDLYGGIGPSPAAPTGERVKDVLWYGPGSIENVMEMGPFRLNPATGFAPVAGDIGVGMRMAYTAGGLGAWNGPVSYNGVFATNTRIEIESKGVGWRFDGATLRGANGLSGAAGQAVVFAGGAGQGTGAGGKNSVSGGTSGTGATGRGGDQEVFGGSSNATNGDGGTATIRGGLKAGTGKDGSLRLAGFSARRLPGASTHTTSATLTAVQVADGYIKVNNGTGVGTSLTLPTAADLDAERPDLASTDSWWIYVVNQSAVAAEDVTMVTNTGWTLTGNGNMVVQEGTSAIFMVQKTAASGAYHLIRVSG